MPTIIPHKIPGKNSDFVVVPRKVFEEFLVWQKHWHNKAKSFKTSKPTAWEKKVIREGRKAIRAGDYIALDELKEELKL